MSTTVTETTNPAQVVVANPDPNPHSTTRNIPPASEDKVFQAVARGDRAGKLNLRGVPTFTDPYAERQWIREHMAAAFRYFGREGHNEGISGHISVRGMAFTYSHLETPFNLSNMVVSSAWH